MASMVKVNRDQKATLDTAIGNINNASTTSTYWIAKLKDRISDLDFVVLDQNEVDEIEKLVRIATDAMALAAKKSHAVLDYVGPRQK